jgi:hypothetical protein
MLGASQPFGFRPYRHLAGGVPSRTTEQTIASAYDTAIGVGDPVALIGDGSIVQCAANVRVLGIFDGVQYIDVNSNVVFTNRWTADAVATEIKANVVSDPMVTFEVESAKVTAPDQSDVGLIADHVVAVPNALHGTSGAYLHATQSTAVAQWRIIGLIPKPYNTGQVFDTVEVTCVEHEYLPIFGGTPGV